MARRVAKFANQRQITIHKEKCDKENIYAKINKEAMFLAMRTFPGQKAPAFELWCYLASQMDGYVFALSQAELEASIGMKEDAYTTAFGRLVDAGYLVLSDKNTIYEFYELPQKKTD